MERKERKGIEQERVGTGKGREGESNESGEEREIEELNTGGEGREGRRGHGEGSKSPPPETSGSTTETICSKTCTMHMKQQNTYLPCIAVRP